MIQFLAFTILKMSEREAERIVACTRETKVLSGLKNVVEQVLQKLLLYSAPFLI